MSNDYGIDAGHGIPQDIGATGVKQEDDLTLAVGNKVLEYLKDLGYKVTNCRPPSAKDLLESLYLRCIFANRDNVGVFCSIHFNASPEHNAHGSEVYAISKTGQLIASNVLNEICKLGYENRGVKDGSHLYVLNHTNMTAILVECCFIDNKEDMNRFDVDTMAKAIVKGLTGKDVSYSKKRLEAFAEWDSIKRATIRTIQLLCNTGGFRDKFGNVLACDGVIGDLTFSALPSLSVGSSLKNFVRIMQDILILKGMNLGKYGADGDFGQATLAAVKDFQVKNDLIPDGICGKNTWLKLLY